MLDLKILKVEHSGKEEAEKLEPFIEECDLFSPEFSYALEITAQIFDEALERSIEKNDFSFFEDEIKPYTDKLIPGIRTYVLTQYFLLFKHKKPTFYLERHSIEENARFMDIEREIEVEQVMAITKYLSTKDIEKFAETFWNILRIEIELLAIRDKNMAQSISTAERLVREKYKKLGDKSCINLTIVVGSLHSPERYITLPSSVIELHKHKTNLEEQIYAACIKGEKLEEVKDKVVAHLRSLDISL
jgi:hypothetical protein